MFAVGSEMKCDFHSGGNPTYWPTDTNKTPDLIDLFVVKGLSRNYIHVEDTEELSSDHSPYHDAQ